MFRINRKRAFLTKRKILAIFCFKKNNNELWNKPPKSLRVKIYTLSARIKTNILFNTENEDNASLKIAPPGPMSEIGNYTVIVACRCPQLYQMQC